MLVNVTPVVTSNVRRTEALVRLQIMNNCLFARHTLAPFSPNFALIS